MSERSNAFRDQPRRLHRSGPSLSPCIPPSPVSERSNAFRDQPRRLHRSGPRLSPSIPPSRPVSAPAYRLLDSKTRGKIVKIKINTPNKQNKINRPTLSTNKHSTGRYESTLAMKSLYGKSASRGYWHQGGRQQNIYKDDLFRQVLFDSPLLSRSLSFAILRGKI